MMINNNLGGLPIQVIVNRDRWQETEADSGGDGNDTIKGTDGVLATPRLIGGAGFPGCDALDQAGVARIKGLAALLPPVAAWLGTAAETASLSASGRVPADRPGLGRGRHPARRPGQRHVHRPRRRRDHRRRPVLHVRDQRPDQPGRPGHRDRSHRPDGGQGDRRGNFGPGTAGMTLQQAVFAGLVDPGNLVSVREIVKPTGPSSRTARSAAPVNCDTAVFAGPRSQYTITANANGSVTVVDTTSAAPAVRRRGEG